MRVEERTTRSAPPVALSAAMLAMMMASSTFPTFLFGAVAPFIIDEFGLTRSELGMLSTVLFASAAALSPVMGSLSARHSMRTGYTVLFLVSAAGVAGLGLADDHGRMLLFAGFGGIAIALSNPVTNQMIPDLVTSRWRGLVVGIKQSGVQIGAMVTGVALPLMVATLGWRTSLLTVSGAMLLVWIGFLPMAPGAGHAGGAEARRPAVRTTARLTVLALSGYAFVMGSGVSAMMNYLPLYGFESAGLSGQVAGSLLSFVSVTGITARIVVGHLASRRSDVVVLLSQLALLGALGLVLVLLAPVVATPGLWVGALVFGINLAWNSIVMIAVVDSDRINTATGSAYVMMGFYAGFIVVPPLFGRVVDLTDSYVMPWTALALLMALTAAVTFVASRRSATL